MFCVPLANPPEGGWPESPPPSPFRPPSPAGKGDKLQSPTKEEYDDEVAELGDVKGTKSFFLEALVKAPERTPEERTQLLQEIAKETTPRASDEMSWKLSVYSTTCFDFCFDSRKAEREKTLKAEWSKDATRAERAREARSRFLADDPAGGDDETNPEEQRAAATIPGLPPDRVGQHVEPSDARVISSEEREQRLTTVEAAMQSFSKAMEERLDNRQIYSQQSWKRLSEARGNRYEAHGSAVDRFWDKHEDNMDVMRHTHA